MRVLIVGPRFHGYLSAMGAALQELGHEVSLHSYDVAATRWEAVKNKAAHDLPERWAAQWKDWQTSRAVRVLGQARPDALLIVKGDHLGDSWWEAVERWNGPRLVWMYDELDRMAYTPDRLATFPLIASYSTGDVAALSARGLPSLHLPLAYDSLLPWHRRPVGAVTFIGARYPQRERMLRSLAAGIAVRAYGRDWSRHPVDVAKSRHWRSSGVPAGRTLDRAEAYGVMAGSDATLNIHGRQDGFTMRTFEACGVGGVQLVDRPDVDRYFVPGEEILVFRDDEELVELAARVAAEPRWARRVADAGRRRALAEHTFVHRMREVQKLWA